MICARCGSTEVEDAAYCSNCGATLAAPAAYRSETTSPAAETAAAAAPPPISGQAPPEDPYRADYERAKAAGFPQPRRGNLGTGSFMSSLFDINFRTFVTPKVVKVVYVLIMIVLGLSAIAYALFAFRVNVGFGVISLVILCPLYFFIWLALWRIILEIFVVVFRIAEDLHAIRVRGDARAAAAETFESGAMPTAYWPPAARASDQ